MKSLPEIIADNAQQTGPAAGRRVQYMVTGYWDVPDDYEGSIEEILEDQSVNTVMESIPCADVVHASVRIVE